MNFSSTRENDEIINKLDRVLGTCLNIRENIDLTIKKLTLSNDIDITDNLNTIAANLNIVMRSADPFFKYYLAIPNNVERDDSKYFSKISTVDIKIKP
jgi:hypothetical protein